MITNPNDPLVSLLVSDAFQRYYHGVMRTARAVAFGLALALGDCWGHISHDAPTGHRIVSAILSLIIGTLVYHRLADGLANRLFSAIVSTVRRDPSVLNRHGKGD